ncbi:Synembryn-A [Ooceraea biroi]|uniref:Synembryn-A n=1 Tax=Ooceraea biroi TaxID=2015173 RepID=A0A026WGM7_OOCBI|nr:Synembryn-A [Ooceraea biroi]
MEQYDKQMTITELNNDCLREKLWKKLFHYLRDYSHLDHCHHFIAALRILSRDKTNLNDLITDDALNIILQNASLTKICEEKQISYTTVTIESLKLLCNLLYNSVKVQQSDVVISCLPYLIDRVGNYNNDVPHDVKLFDIRILFLITALNTSTRNIIKNDIRGDVCLIKILEDFVAQNKDSETVAVQTEEITILCEVLKVLFNLYIHSDSVAIEDQEKYRNLELILSKLLTFKYAQQQDDLESFVVNLFTVIPFSHPTPIIQSTESKNAHDNTIMYGDADMSTICVLLKFLDKRLDCKTRVVENISPVITALIRLVKAEKIIREYVRFQILPPLKDVMNRPEEGTTSRAKLCKLLTSPLTELHDLVAELLFVLCKENVSRMVKYTGYGNAAGMLAKKGLLGRSQAETHSSDSEDSETEEYLKYKEQINPIIGCYEPPKSNPLEGMTEEQKEYEALQLVNLVDKLTREGVVRPCRIVDDGKPEPIEHVLELQNELPKQQYGRKDSDSE